MGRRLGQHFLTDPHALRRIAALACPQPEALVLEIGPGKGALTRHLRPRCQRLIAIELDAALAQALRAEFPPSEGVEVLTADVLATDLTQWGAAVVVGNLPYYITSPILKQVLGLGALLRRAVFLVQREVAARLAAAPGSRDYGYLSVLAQTAAEVQFCFPVPARAFRPAPKVDSAVVLLTPADPMTRWGIDDVPAFVDFVGCCFRQKRKTLANNLRLCYPKQRVDALAAAPRRAEQLSLAELVSVWRALRPIE